MKEKNFKNYGNEEACPVRNVIDRIGDKWSLLVLLLLEDAEVLRFNEICRHIKTISQKMLAVTLKNLESDGLIKRTVFAQVPPKVEYRLTKRGKSLLPHIHGLVEWAARNMNEINHSRAEYEKVTTGVYN